MRTPVVIDTHTFIWYLEDHPQLSEAAAVALDAASDAGEPIFVSAATAVELQYVHDKGRLTGDEYLWCMAILESSNGAIEVAPVDMGVARAAELISRKEVADPFDRMIAATATALGVPLVTSDRKLHKLGIVETVW